MIEYFTDPVLRAPTIGSMLMCFVAGLIGVLFFVRKKSLVGETLAHATYPGVTLAVIASSAWGGGPFFILAGAFVSALLGLAAINYLERKLRLRDDVALCLILAAFFGIGITIASYVQFFHTHEYRNIQAYLYGQAATMTDSHLPLYASMAALSVFAIALFYKELHALCFDRSFASLSGMSAKGVELLSLFLTVLAVVIGIRSVGVILMSAMLIAPPVAARQFTNRFSTLLILSALFGALAGFLGNVFSVTLSTWLAHNDPAQRISLPTGPMIVLVASSLSFFSLLFAPERGVVIRFFRIAHFRYARLQENILKAMWRAGPKSLSLAELKLTQDFSLWYLKIVLRRMERRGWLKREQKWLYALTEEGKKQGGRIVRLHRLWEVYLVDYLGMGVERVHKSAEEMEHILTPTLEKKLTELLNDPKEDPHQQPIPAQHEVMSHG